MVNRKRIYRLYCEEGLQLTRKRPKRHKSAVARRTPPAVTQPGEAWAVDFVHDQLADGRTFQVSTAVDVFTRECMALVARRTFSGADVAAVLGAVGQDSPLPARIQCDNGSQFTSRAFDQ
jgi:putative transposase